MEYLLDDVKTILSKYKSITEPELVLGFNKTVYKITVMSDCCSVTAYNKKIVGVDISFEELFSPNHEVLGLCLHRDWEKVTIFRCVPDLSEPDKVVQRYLNEQKLFPNQQVWSNAVVNYCLKYLTNTYGESWLRKEPMEQDIPYFRLDDGSYLAIEYVRGLHGIIVEIADNEDDAYNYGFEDAANIYERFDCVDSLWLLKETINDCWADYVKQVGQ